MDLRSRRLLLHFASPAGEVLPSNLCKHFASNMIKLIVKTRTGAGGVLSGKAAAKRTRQTKRLQVQLELVAFVCTCVPGVCTCVHVSQDCSSTCGQCKGGRRGVTYRCRSGRGGVAVGVAIAAVAVRVQGRRDGVGAQLGVAARESAREKERVSEKA